MTITKPKFDLRNYIGGKLNNNIKYIIINDNTLDKTYISVNIKAGSYNEPKGYDGLAHFLEHMLFMGSERYPHESYFMDKVSKYSGFNNAHTQPTETCYYLGFLNDGFDEIIDIFSRFFIDPLFLKDAIDREMNAVNNEHLKNINDDNWIFNQFIRDISSNKNFFSTGNLETLNKKDIRERMIEFYKKYYITQNISICIATNLNTIKVIESLNRTFGTIKEQTSEHINTGIIFKNKGSSYYLKSIRDIYRLVYIWQIPEQFESSQYMTQEFTILGQLLTINIEGSLKFYLKNNGLINNISYYVATEGYFEIYFDLTHEGSESIDTIETLLNSYLELVYRLDFNKIYDYFSKLNMINFNYLNKVDTMDLCLYFSSNLHYYEINDTYIGSSIIKKSNDYIGIFKKYINNMNQIKIIVKQNYKTSSKVKLKYYESYYSIIKLNNFKHDTKYFDKLKTISFSNSLLDIKPIIIKNLDKYMVPKLHKNYWVGGLSKFNEPIIYFTINITNNTYYNNPTNYLNTMISCSVLNYLLSLKFFEAFKVGFTVSFHPSTSLSCIMISGSSLSDNIKFNQFMEELFDFIKNINDNIKILSDSYIESIINSIMMSIMNEMYSNPSQYNQYIVMLLTNPNEYPNEVLLDSIKNINSKMVRKYLERLFIMKSNITSIFYGSIKGVSNYKLSDCFNNKGTSVLPKIKPFWLCERKTCSYDTPFNNRKIIIVHPDKNQKSSSVMFYYNVGPFLPKNNLLLFIIVDILADKFFDELRTKKQLGYLVSMNVNNIMNNYAITQNVQSDQSISVIIESIDYFNKNLFSFIKESEMDEYKERVRNYLNIRDTNTHEVFSRIQSEIFNRTFLFNRKELLIKHIESITFNDIKKFIKRVINDKNCIKIIIKGH